MRFTKPRLQSAGQRRVGEQRIEVDRRPGDGDQMCTRRDRAVQEGQRLATVERATLGHEAGEEDEGTIASGDEDRERDQKSTRLNSRQQCATRLTSPAGKKKKKKRQQT